MFFIIIDYDGWNLGVKEDFSKTWLEFNNFEECRRIALHWEKWILS